MILGRGLLFHSANDKIRRTQWIPACAGMTRLNINFLSRLCCAQTDALCALLFALCLPNGQTALNFYLSRYSYLKKNAPHGTFLFYLGWARRTIREQNYWELNKA